MPSGKKRSWCWILGILIVFSEVPTLAKAGRGHHNRGGNRLIELLTAGIVAKVLQMDGDGGGGGGGGGGGRTPPYYPVPVPMAAAASSHQPRYATSHHVTEKIIPIPIPQHTTRIIHINAGTEGGAGGAGGGSSGPSYANAGAIGGQDDGGHHYDEGSGYDDRRTQIGKSPSSTDSKATIQQLLFTDTGVYGNPQPTHSPLQPAMMTPMPQMMTPMPQMMPHRHPAFIAPAAAAHRFYAIRRPMYSPYMMPQATRAYIVTGRNPLTYTTANVLQQRWPSASSSYYTRPFPMTVGYPTPSAAAQASWNGPSLLRNAFRSW